MNEIAYDQEIYSNGKHKHRIDVMLPKIYINMSEKRLADWLIANCTVHLKQQSMDPRPIWSDCLCLSFSVFLYICLSFCPSVCLSLSSSPLSLFPRTIYHSVELNNASWSLVCFVKRISLIISALAWSSWRFFHISFNVFISFISWSQDERRDRVIGTFYTLCRRKNTS